MTYPLIFGEILFDQFTDSQVLGGAPFNVAWHLQGLGLKPKIVSRIGKDDLGDQIMQEIHAWQLDDSYIQRDDEHATGTVKITLDQGQPTFNITEDVAYDHIGSEDILSGILKNPPSLVYHGSLAIRQQTSRNTLLQLRKKLACPVFVDINMRAPWWDSSMLDEILTGTSWLKLNEQELQIITDNQTGDEQELEVSARNLLKEYQLQAIIVTLGERGAFIVDASSCYRSKPAQVTSLVDAVGAGDGFSAITILGLLQGWNYSQILNRATAFAAQICQQRGAINTDRDFYARQMSKWT